MDAFRKIILILLAFYISFDATFARRRQSGSSAQSPSDLSVQTSDMRPSWLSRLKQFFVLRKKESEEVKSNAAVCIFLDDTETEQLRAISWNFIKALYHKACPIIVTHALMKNILTCTSSNRNFFALKDARSLFKSRKNDPKTYPAFSKNLPSDLAFSDKDWVMKQIGEFGYLLIPVKYLDHMGIPEAINSESKANEYEKRCGFRITHMKTVNSKDILYSKEDSDKKQVYEGDFFKALYDDQTESGSLFCSESSTAWSIFINGHGSIGTDETRKIAGLSFQGYKNFLDFLNSKISCRVLINNTCFGSGVNAKLTYADDANYSYDIILKGTGDTVTRTSAGFQGVYSPHANFKEFVNVVTQQEIDYEKAVLSISDPLLNVPLIRRAGSTNFKPLFKNVFVISKDTFIDKKLINVPELYTILFIELDNIVIDLKIMTSKLQAIFMKSPSIIDYIKKIEGLLGNNIDIVRAFMAMDQFQNNALKIIKIDEINNLRDILIVYNPTKNMVQAFYHENNTLYCIEKSKDDVFVEKLVSNRANEPQKKSYEESLKYFDDFSNGQRLRLALGSKDFAEIISCLEYSNKKIDQKDSFKAFNEKKQTPLHLAVIENNKEAVTEILELAISKKIDLKTILEAKDNEDKTPYDYARDDEIKNMVDTNKPFNIYKNRQLFRDFAANKGDFSPESLKEKYEYGNTELHIAARDGDVEKIKIFCDQPDPDFFIKNYKGETILHVAAANGRLEIVKQLLDRAEKKKDLLEDLDNEGNTPLHSAALAQENSDAMITFMRQYEPDETIQNNNKKTAAQLLVEYKKNDDDFLFGNDQSVTSTMDELD
jgi:ankyrin repeat protein